MFLHHLKRHGHGHGHGHEHHKKMHKHAKGHKKFGHFKHPGGHHMGYGPKHRRGLNFKQGFFSENETPNINENIEAGTHDACEFNLRREFHTRRGHHWRFKSCGWKQNDLSKTNDNVENNKTNNAIVIDGDNKDTDKEADAPVTSTQNIEGQDKTQVYHHKGRHYFRSYGFTGICQKCMQNNRNTTENEATTDGEKDDNVKEGLKEKHRRGSHKGKRGQGFRRPCKQCHEESGTETDGITEDEGGVRHRTIRKHYRGRHSGKGPKFGMGCPKDFHKWFDAEKEQEGKMLYKRHFHGGKLNHGQHKNHHGGWRRHGYCVLMIDAAVNTGDFDSEEIEAQEDRGQEDLNAGQTMEQEATEEVSQNQTEAETVDQVLAVADNLRKSSLE